MGGIGGAAAPDVADCAAGEVGDREALGEVHEWESGMESGAERFEQAVLDFPVAEVGAGDADELVGCEEVGSGTGVGDCAVAGCGAIFPVGHGPGALPVFLSEVEARGALGVASQVDAGLGRLAEADDGEPVVGWEVDGLEVEVIDALDVLFGGLEHLSEELVCFDFCVVGVESVDSEGSFDAFED